MAAASGTPSVARLASNFDKPTVLAAANLGTTPAVDAPVAKVSGHYLRGSSSGLLAVSLGMSLLPAL